MKELIFTVAEHFIFASPETDRRSGTLSLTSGGSVQTQLMHQGIFCWYLGNTSNYPHPLQVIFVFYFTSKHFLIVPSKTAHLTYCAKQLEPGQTFKHDKKPALLCFHSINCR